MERLGERGDISIGEVTCNKDIGCNGLEEMPGNKKDSRQEYLDLSGRHTVDMQINIDKFGKEMHNGLLNTKEMAHAWNWHSDSDELNWRGKPCALRTSYDEKTGIFEVHIWNDLIQMWAKLSLTKEEIKKVIGAEKIVYKTPNLKPYCDEVTSKELKNGIEWDYIKDGESLGTAFMSYKELYEIQIGKSSSKCQFCDSSVTRKYRPTYEDEAIWLCEQHEKYIQRVSQKLNGKVDEV